jgi:transposase-like protein
MDGMAVKQSSKEMEWRQRLARFAASGQRINEFCRSESVSQATFHRWRKQLANPADKASGAGFIDVGTMAPQSMSAQGAALEVRLELGGGLVLHIVRR